MLKFLAATLSLATLALALSIPPVSAAPIGGPKPGIRASDLTPVAGCVRGYRFSVQLGRCVRIGR